MADRLSLMLEADRRGLLPPEKKALLDEAVKRGLVEGQTSMVDQAARQVGLTARYGIEGVTAIPNMVGDVLGLESSKAVSDLLTKAGLPKPEGAKERVVGDVTRAMAGQAGVMKAGDLMAKSAGPVVSRVGDFLRSQPQSQIVAAGGAGAGAGTAREMGYGPGIQTVAGLAGGVAAPVAASAVTAGVGVLGRGVKAAVEPFTKAGRERVVGGTLKRLATDAGAASERMGRASELVSGSRPTTAQAARDEGLLIAERGLASSSQRAGSQFARRSAEQNQARNALLNELAKDDTALKAAKGVRAGEASGLYSKSFSEAVKPPEELVSLSKRPAFTEAVKRAQAIAAEEGTDLGDPMNTMKGLHYVKLGLDDIISGARDSSIGKTQQRAIIETQKKLLSIMDDLSPTYKQARSSFKELSAPVNQLESLQGVREKVLNTGTDALTGERIMSAAKFSNVLNKAESRGELQKVLTKEQFKALESIAADLERGALSATSGKAAGSNTMQNLSVAHVLGAAMGGKAAATNPVLRTLTAPFKWVGDLSGNEAAVQDLLADAMLDPAMARNLMAKATPQKVESAAFELLQRAKAQGFAGSLGTGSSVGRPQQTERPTEQ